MGGKQSKDITRQEIETSINTTIQNYNKIATDIINSQITTSTMTLVNENAQAIAAATGGGNALTLGNLNVSGRGSVFNITQRVDVRATNQAVSNMTQDSSAMARLASQINNDVMSKLQNDAALTQSLQAASDLSKSTSTAGGLSDMVGKVMDTMGSVLTPGTTMNSEHETKIKNSVMMNLSNTNISETKVKNLVESNIQNTISQKNAASCNINTSANNTLTVGDVVIDSGGQAVITQIANVNALNSCVLGAAQTTKMVSDITSGNDTKSTTDTGNKTTASQGMSADSTISEKTETHDAFGQMISSFSPFSSIGGSIACIVCMIVIVFLVMTMMG